ncbi:MAG TPA: hypothetical protein VEQ10_19130 [Vicinamibacteria bacterium]|nr:hypothetical protein [Vicinamibacteria bacterium]
MGILFGAFALDRATRQLQRGAELRPLEPKAYALLELLISRRPAAVSKQEIRDRLWPWLKLVFRAGASARSTATEI